MNNGVIIFLVGFAPVRPAEFVIIKIQQIAGRTPQNALRPPDIR
jgi:phage tail sheath protein FI